MKEILKEKNARKRARKKETINKGWMKTEKPGRNKEK